MEEKDINLLLAVQAPKSSMASVGSASPFAAASISAFAPTGDLDTELAMDQVSFFTIRPQKH